MKKIHSKKSIENTTSFVKIDSMKKTLQKKKKEKKTKEKTVKKMIFSHGFIIENENVS